MLRGRESSDGDEPDMKHVLVEKRQHGSLDLCTWKHLGGCGRKWSEGRMVREASPTAHHREEICTARSVAILKLSVPHTEILNALESSQ